MSEEQQPIFRNLTDDLPDDHKAAFFQTLHEAGITPKDVELAQLLRALQLYKAYYESIPPAVQKAADRIEQLKKDIEYFSTDARGNLELSIHLAGQMLQESDKIHKDFTQINKHIEKAMQLSAENLASNMAKQLAVGIEERILTPFQGSLERLAASNKAFDEAITRNVKAAATLERNTAIARRFNFRTYLICGLLVLATLAGITVFSLSRWYENRLNIERQALIKQTEQNRSVLLQLSKSRRTLELLSNPKHPNRKLLVMKDAAGWQAAGKQGVLEFDE
jgi:hypothetical protein